MAEDEGNITKRETTREEEVACPHCGKKIETKAVVKGFSVICPYCDSLI